MKKVLQPRGMSIYLSDGNIKESQHIFCFYGILQHSAILLICIKR